MPLNARPTALRRASPVILPDGLEPGARIAATGLVAALMLLLASTAPSPRREGAEGGLRAAAARVGDVTGVGRAFRHEAGKRGMIGMDRWQGRFLLRPDAPALRFPLAEPPAGSAGGH